MRIPCFLRVNLFAKRAAEVQFVPACDWGFEVVLYNSRVPLHLAGS